MKQYYIKEAYSGDYHIVRIVDGEIEYHDIIPVHEFAGYTNALKTFGYKPAYYMCEYEKMKKNPLVLSERAEEELKRMLYI